MAEESLADMMSHHDQWDCILSISPQRVLEGNEVRLETTLSHPGVKPADIDYGKFNYVYTSTDPRIQKAIDDANSELEHTTVVSSTPQIRQSERHFQFLIPHLPEGSYEGTVTVTRQESSRVGPPFPQDGVTASASFTVAPRQVQAAVTLQRSGTLPTNDQALWVAIRNRTSALDFTRYQRFINCIFCTNDSFDLARLIPDSSKIQTCLDIPQAELRLSIHGPYAYALLKLATQVFLTLECGVVIRNSEMGGHDLFHLEDEIIRLNDSSVSLDDLNRRLKLYLAPDNQHVLPYLDRIVQALVGLDPERQKEVLPYCYGILQHRLTCPSLLELIWSYWHEEGMLVQTMNAIAFRFQNRRSSPRDPLGELELDPLRPLNNLIWGLIQDEHNRLTVSRRAYEYDHHYGLQLIGKAVPNLASADSRSKFIEAFHNLLYRTAVFYKEDADTTVIADAFPLLNALKEVHLLLAEGAHNQFGDLPWTARAEMLSMQWLLARPEMREFLRGRYMVPYQEPWMGAVDSMKKLQGWTDTTVTHFHELAVTGERILLSVRYGNWSDINNNQEQAKNWARYEKPDIQLYLHGYYAVTGVDLMSVITDSREAAQRFLQPSRLLQRRLSAQRAPRALPAARATRAVTSEVPGYAELPMPRRG